MRTKNEIKDDFNARRTVSDCEQSIDNSLPILLEVFLDMRDLLLTQDKK